MYSHELVWVCAKGMDHLGCVIENVTKYSHELVWVCAEVMDHLGCVIEHVP